MFYYVISRKKNALVGIQWLSYVASCGQGVFIMLGLKRTTARSSSVFLCSGEVVLYLDEKNVLASLIQLRGHQFCVTRSLFIPSIYNSTSVHGLL